MSLCLVPKTGKKVSLEKNTKQQTQKSLASNNYILLRKKVVYFCSAKQGAKILQKGAVIKNNFALAGGKKNKLKALRQTFFGNKRVKKVFSGFREGWQKFYLVLSVKLNLIIPLFSHKEQNKNFRHKSWSYLSVG